MTSCRSLIFGLSSSLLSCLLPFAVAGAVWAEADGPDYFALRDLPAGRTQPLLAAPDRAAPHLAALPAGAQCLRNLGCQGGLTQAEFAALSDPDLQARMAAQPRWCKVVYQGAVGWVEGPALAEGACQSARDPAQRFEDIRLADGEGKVALKGRIKGYAFMDYRVHGGAGQKLSIQLSGKHAQNYFNLLAPGSDQAMFVGSTSGDRFAGILPVEGEYIIRVYLMRAAARRHAVSTFDLQVALTGKPMLPLPPRQDALVEGTAFHAAASLPCATSQDGASGQCPAWVMRRSRAGDATLVVISQEYGVDRRQRVLFLQGMPVSSDTLDEITAERDGDRVKIRLGDRLWLTVPDAFLSGG